MTSTHLFDPQKCSRGYLSALWKFTKIGLACALALPLVPLLIKDYPESYFFYLFNQGTVMAVPFFWLMWLIVWTFGGVTLWPYHAAVKLLAEMEPIWLEGFKKHTGVVNRISVNGYTEKGLIQVDGIAYKDQLIFFMTRGRVFSFPFSSVRGWQWKVETADTVSVHGTGIQAAAIKASVTEANLSAAGRAFLCSGFFVEIADENNPVLHFHSDDQTILQKWHEIFRQIDEGKI